jgi:hypothetical protein
VLKKISLFVLILLGILVVLVYPKVYVIRGTAGGVLYWNAKEALLFMSGGSEGARMSYPRYAFGPLLEALRFVRAADEQRCSEIVAIRVSDNDVQRYDTDLYRYTDGPNCDFTYRLFDGHFYAVEWPKLWRWSGASFERPTPEEYGTFATATFRPKSVFHPWEFDDIDGWSMRAFGQTPPRYELLLNGKPVTIVFSGETSPQRPLSVDLIRPGQAPQRIWSFDGRPHRVSRVEYERAFAQR